MASLELKYRFIIAIIVLTILDVITTSMIMQVAQFQLGASGSAYDIEFNPIMRLIMYEFGEGWIIFKLFITMLVVSLIYKNHIPMRTIIFVTLALVFVVSSNIFTIFITI